MKFKNYKKDTYKICMKYLNNQNAKTEHQLTIILQKWYHSYDPYYEGPYNYGERNVLEVIEYCSDRMNKGRAEAILMLL